ncbi:MAG: hypothetical protein JXR69_08525 [Candidatus Delongbacteria bacterium]|nr:hypothetical protein [Candidatus Delongbacteria bacterium]
MKKIIILAVVLAIVSSYAQRLKCITTMYDSPKKETVIYATFTDGSVYSRGSADQKWDKVSMDGVPKGTRFKELTVTYINGVAVLYALSYKDDIYSRISTQEKWGVIEKNGLPAGRLENISATTADNVLVTYATYPNGDIYYRTNKEKVWIKINTDGLPTDKKKPAKPMKPKKPVKNF